MAKELKAEVRKDKGTRQMNRLRNAGRIPAVVYGGDRKESMPLSIDEREFANVLKKGERVLSLAIGDQKAQVLVKDVQYDALGEIILHVDFNELRAGEKVRLSVAVVLRGVPKGATDGGILNHMLHEIEVECDPAAIPERLTVEVDHLVIGDMIHVSDIKLPEGVKLIAKATDVVASCTEPRKEEVAAPVAAEGASSEPEVLTEKKAEGEGEEGVAAATDAKAADTKKAPEAKKKEGK
jgi:large subunit ribosomal protein L25